MLINVLDLILKNIIKAIESGRIDYITFCSVNHLKLSKIPLSYLEDYHHLLNEC